MTEMEDRDWRESFAVPPMVERDYMNNVVTLLSQGIPRDSWEHCKLESGTAFPSTGSVAEKRSHLLQFVRDRLNTLARLEYTSWINGQIPFVSPRELQLWRLRLLVQYVWFWEVPADDDIAMIFNLTKRRAGNLISDFFARFRKTFLFPVAIRRIYELLTTEPLEPEIEYRDSLGSVFEIPTPRYVHDTNLLISEFRIKRETVILRDAKFYEDSDYLMWVSDRVVELVSDEEMRQELFDLYPLVGTQNV